MYNEYMLDLIDREIVVFDNDSGGYYTTTFDNIFKGLIDNNPFLKDKDIAEEISSFGTDTGYRNELINDLFKIWSSYSNNIYDDMLDSYIVVYNINKGRHEGIKLNDLFNEVINYLTIKTMFNNMFSEVTPNEHVILDTLNERYELPYTQEVLEKLVKLHLDI